MMILAWIKMQCVSPWQWYQHQNITHNALWDKWVSWFFTPGQPVQLYQGDRDKRKRPHGTPSRHSNSNGNNEQCADQDKCKMRIIIKQKAWKLIFQNKKTFFLKKSMLSLKKMQHDIINEPANGTSTKANYWCIISEFLGIYIPKLSPDNYYSFATTCSARFIWSYNKQTKNPLPNRHDFTRS